MTRMNRKYDKAFKFEAIQLYETNGKSVSQIETEVFPKYADPLQSGSVRYVAHNEILAVHYEKFPYATIPRKTFDKTIQISQRNGLNIFTIICRNYSGTLFSLIFQNMNIHFGTESDEVSLR
jgi:hypothetical protein